MSISMNTATTDPLVGRQLGDFIVKEKLGEGGFGAVYKASQITLAREAVIKVLHIKHRTNPQIIERFKREAQLASKLEHPYCAHIYSFGAEPDGLLWLAMEMVAGTPLNEIIKLQGPLPLERFVPLLDKIAEVVHTAHDFGIIHRDLKPANVIVISRAGRLLPKLLDFGIAKGLGVDSPSFSPEKSQIKTNNINSLATKSDGKTTDPNPLPAIETVENLPENQETDEDKGKTGVIGSPPYMSPEQWGSGADVDTRTDIYALGVMSYEMLKGEVPFTDSGYILIYAHVNKPVPPLGKGFPLALDNIIAKAMAKKAEDRYPTALEFAKEFREAAGFSEQQINLPQLDELLKEDILANAPKPLADTIASLVIARNIYQFRDRVLLTFRILVRYLGILALASYIRTNTSKQGNEIITKAITNLRQQGLSDAQWVEFSRELCRPFAKKRDAFPIPELISLFFAENSEHLSPLIEVFTSLLQTHQEIHSNVSSKEEKLTSLLTDFLAKLTKLLTAVYWLNDYYLVKSESSQAIKLMGKGQDFGLVTIKNNNLPTSKVSLIDANGCFVLSLWPLVEIVEPTPGTPLEVFLLECKGRRGARLVSFPDGFEIEEETPWQWFKEHFLTDEEKKQTGTLTEKSPYLGLTTFSPTDSNLFFGREVETENFLNRLRIQALLVVVGPSGAGKSSFIQAGVISGLPQNWQVLTVRPGISPLSTLASKLSKVGVELGNLKYELQRDIDYLGKTLHKFLVKQNVTMLLVIDQFEEIITLCLDKEEQRLYVDAIVSSARSEEDPIRVVLTMRDDFLVRAKELNSLKNRLTQSLEILTTPDSTQLLRILTEPARRAGYEFEDRELPVEIVNSVTGQTSALPLIAFTAAKLWEQRDKEFKQLRRRSYELMGGVGGALACHAEDMMQQMITAEQVLVREAFRHLVTSEGTRAILTRPEVLQLLGKTDEGEAVIEKMISARLLVSTEGEKSIERIEIVHEALLSSWPRLAKWRQEDVDGVRLRDQLRAAVKQWEERGKPKGLLWRDEALTEYKLWHSRYSGKLTDVENAFATASINEASRAQRQRRILSSVAAIFLAITSIVFYFQNQETKEKILSLYEEQGRQALLANKPDQAVLYLTEAYSGGNNKYSLKFLLSQSLLQFNQAQPLTIAGHKNFVFHSIFSPDGKNILSASADKTAKLWQSSTGKLLRSFEGHKDCVRSASFSPDASKLVTASLDGTAKIWKTDTAEVLLTLSGHNAAVNSAIFSHDGKLIATSGLDRTAKIWDAQSGQMLFSLEDHQGSVNYVAFSSDNKKLVTASSDNTAKIWDAISGKLLVTLSGHENSVNSVCFSPDNLLIVTASSDNTAKIWDAISGKELRILKDHTSVVNSAQFSSDGKLIITSSTDRTAKIWQTENGKLMNSLKVYDFPLKWASFNNDGSRVVLASNDNTMKICNVELEKRDATTIAELVEKTIPIRFEKDSFAPNLKAQITVKPAQKTPTSTPTPEIPHPEKVASVPALPSELNLKTFDFLTVKLDDQGKISEQIKKQAQYFTQELVSGPGIDMVFIPEGSFPMGQQDCGANDKEACPKREVKLSAFYMSKFEVTQAQWKAVMGNNPSHFKGDDNLPVEQVTWYDAMEFCERLSQKTGKLFRLPSEAEWEYAARAGTTTMFAFGNTINSEIVNYDGTFPYGKAPKSLYRKQTIPVGSLGVANGFGLYDIHGNVSEWCLDPLHENYIGAPQDGSSWIENGQLNNRIVRGGSYNNMAALCFAFNRNWNAPTSKYNRYGLRLVMSL